MSRLLVLSLLFVACTHAPAVRPGPPVKTRFAPPAKGALEETWAETRETSIEFEGGERRRISETLGGEVVEAYAPFGDGWRVTSTVRSEGLVRNGEVAALPLSLAGVAFSHHVDALGRFIEPLELDESMREMKERVRDKRLLDLLDAAATPDGLARRAREGWVSRYENGLCNATLEPGDVTYAIEEQQLPAGGLVRMVVRRTVLGEATRQGQQVVELALVYGGASSRLARETDAARLVSEAGGTDALTPDLAGKGRRMLLRTGCHTVFEHSEISGTVKLHEKEAYAPGRTGLPERVRFSVTRRIERTPVASPEK